MDQTNLKPPQLLQENHISVKNIFFLLLFSIILIFSISATYFYFQSKKSSQIPTPTSIPTQSVPSPTSAIDETANWKTYVSKILRVSFNHPLNYRISEDDNGVITIYSPINNNVVIDNKELLVYISIKDAISEDSLDKFYFDVINADNYKKFTKILSKNLIYINNNELYYQQQEEINDPGAGRKSATYFLISNGKRVTFSKYPLVTSREQDFQQILSTFKFLDQNYATTINGVDLKDIKYTLPQGWQAKLSENNLFISAIGGGYLSIMIYNYDGITGRREFFCKLRKFCIDSTYFTEKKIGNILGYIANGLDNSGGGTDYFGAKGNKFYIIKKLSPSYQTPNEFDLHYQEVLNSLVF